MPLRANAVMRFLDYEPVDGGNWRLHFVCFDPGAGMESDYYVTATDAEILAITNLASANTLALAKLNRAIRATGIKAKLDLLIGRDVTVP